MVTFAPQATPPSRPAHVHLRLILTSFYDAPRGGDERLGARILSEMTAFVVVDDGLAS